MTINNVKDETAADSAVSAETPVNSIPAKEEMPSGLSPIFVMPDLSVMKKKGRRKKLITAAIVIAIIAAAVFVVNRFSQRANQAATNTYDLVNAEKRDITVTLNGSGSLRAANSYILTTLISGEVLSADFDEGDIVGKDDLLYQVDSSDISTAIERAEITLNQSRNAYDRKLESQGDLTVRSKEAGTIVSVNVKVGDTVTNGMPIATVRDSTVMCLTLPFGGDDAQQLYVGQTASVTLDGTYETLSGTVSEISRVDQVLPGNMVVRQVTIDVPNPGGISTTHTATATVGEFACNAYGTFDYKSSYTLTASMMGDVAQLYVKEGDWIASDRLVLMIESTNLDLELENAANSLRDAELNLDNQYDKLEAYTINSPIAGTIIEKNYKLGDTLEAGKPLCTIFDLSYLTLTLNIDELDISQVEVGQEVNITADAVPGNRYTGVVTKVNINGSTAGGVTSYPVTIRIDKTDGLLPGMNVDATITIAEVKAALTIPTGAVLRGDRVLVQTDPNAQQNTTDPSTGIPAGFEYVIVKLGVNDDEYVEILSGLTEGATVVVEAEKENGNFIMTPFGQMEMPQGGGAMIRNAGN